MSWMFVLLEKVAPSLAAWSIKKAKQAYEKRGAKKEYRFEDLQGIWEADDEKSLARKIEFSVSSRGDFLGNVEDVFGDKHRFNAEIISKTQLKLTDTKVFYLDKLSRRVSDTYIFKIINLKTFELLHVKTKPGEKPLFLGRFKRQPPLKPPKREERF